MFKLYLEIATALLAIIAAIFWFLSARVRFPNILCFFTFVPLALRARKLLPHGYSMPDYLFARYQGHKKCLRHGMDDYISKPINIDELQDILGQWIKMHFDTVSGDQFEPVDLTQLRALSLGDTQFEKELGAAFIIESDRNAALLEKHCVDGESVGWTEAAHTFKGSANGIGAAKLGLLCAEAQAQKSCSREERKATLDYIKAEYRRVQNYLDKIGLLS